MTEVVSWGEIRGVPITFPLDVDRFHGATIGYTVPADAASALLPGDAFEVAETAPGMAQLIISLCDYRENPWGDYNEVNLGFLARPAGAGPEVMGAFIYRMPVDQEFTSIAGNEVMGFPKVVTQIDAEYTDASVTFRLWEDGAEELTVTLPRAAPAGEVARAESASYSYLGGVPYSTALELDMATGFVDPSDVVVTLGSGPIADELRTLGLPKAPDFCAWGEDLTATFQLGQKV